MTLATNDTTPSAYFNFAVTATITGEDTYPFIGSCVASIAENGGSVISGTTSITTTTGSVTFTVYFASLGSKTITCTCPAVGSSPGTSATVSMTVLINYLKINSFTPVVIII